MMKLLIVEDSALMRKLLGQVFSAEGDFELAFARDGVEALELVRTFKPDVVTLDIHMPQMDGLTCLDRMMVIHPCPVVMVSSLTAEGAEETLAALDMGAVDFVAKPAGAISLDFDMLAPRIIEKVRMAAKVRVRRSRRLADRLRMDRQLSSNAVKPTPPKRTAGQSRGLILVGTSTGGPAALDVLLSDLPLDFPWPVVVAQHMPAAFTGPLSRRLDKICALDVVEVSGRMNLDAGTIYIARGDADIIVSSRAGQLIAMPAPSDSAYRWHPSVERLVRSAMKHVPATDLIGVLMTGMGNDGAPAMAEMRLAGGYAIAEAEETAVVWGMPGELVRLKGASEVLPLGNIGARVAELAT
ncbi:MAG: chemotaxis response regulator protein-glutamate methylesterase [Rhizobium sp.]|nr:chemotaxis response regulator protein-glutamate methylesterase [Rhizobium sp.]